MAAKKTLTVISCAVHCDIHDACVRPMKDARVCTDAELTCCGQGMIIGHPSQFRREQDGLVIPAAYCPVCKSTERDLKLYFR
jgi:hypothetical protein